MPKRSVLKPATPAAKGAQARSKAREQVGRGCLTSPPGTCTGISRAVGLQILMAGGLGWGLGFCISDRLPGPAELQV